MTSILDIDQQMFLWLNGFNHEILDPFMSAFSGQYVWALMYAAIIGAICWRYGWRRGLMLVAIVGLTIGCADVICSQVIRPLAGRLRPANPANPISVMVHIVEGYRGGSFGFPSCHASNTFALAMCTSILMQKWGYTAFIYIWAILQCYSRIYLGVHYPGDIAAGAFIGSLIALIAMRLIRRTPLLADAQTSPPKAQYALPVYAAAAITIIGIIISIAI